MTAGVFIGLAVLVLVLWVIFGDDAVEAIYAADELDDEADDLEPPDARAWRDPWRDE